MDNIEIEYSIGGIPNVTSLSGNLDCVTGMNMNNISLEASSTASLHGISGIHGHNTYANSQNLNSFSKDSSHKQCKIYLLFLTERIQGISKKQLYKETAVLEKKVRMALENQLDMIPNILSSSIASYNAQEVASLFGLHSGNSAGGNQTSGHHPFLLIVSDMPYLYLRTIVSTLLLTFSKETVVDRVLNSLPCDDHKKKKYQKDIKNITDILASHLRNLLGPQSSQSQNASLHGEKPILIYSLMDDCFDSVLCSTLVSSYTKSVSTSK